MCALYTNEHHFVFFLHEAYMYVEKNFRITWHMDNLFNNHFSSGPIAPPGTGVLAVQSTAGDMVS